MLKRLAVNSASNLTFLLINMALTFVMAPFYLEMMGHHDYGLREMIIALIGHMGMIDLGMRPTMSRFAARYHAQKDQHSLNVVYACSFVFMGVVGLLVATFFWCWAAFYPEILADTDNANSYKYYLFLLAVGTQVLFAFPRFVTESFLEGLQFYYVKNFIEIIGSISIAVLSYSYMNPRNALLLLTAFTIIISAIKLLLFGAMLMTKRYGNLSPSLGGFKWPKLKEMLNFGFKSFVQGAANKVETMSDRLVIGGILGPASIPVYTISLTLVSYIRNITATLTHAFMPFFSALDANDRRSEIRQVYLSASKIVVGLAMPMGVGISIVGAPFVDVWMKGQFQSETVNSIIILLVVYMITPTLNPFASRFLTAINEHDIYAKIAPIAALANLGLSIWAVIEFGVIGAAIGSVLPVLFVTPVYLKYSCHHLGITIISYVKHSILPALLPTFVMGGTVLWLRLEWGFTSYVRLIIGISAGAMLYASIFWLLAMTKTERTWLLSRILPKKPARTPEH